MGREHHYRVKVKWTGNLGEGTSDYRAYKRDHTITAARKKTPIDGSSDPSFLGDETRWNPEDLLVASLSACHKLWYLGLCAVSGISVLEYIDAADGVMVEGTDGAGRFTSVTLKPTIKLARGSDLERAKSLHHDAHEKCFIANSVNFPVACAPKIICE